MSNKRGVSLLELILVIIIMAISAALVFPRAQRGIEHREAKHALETLKTISNAVRLYELNHGNLLDDSIPPQPINLADLESGGYLRPTEYTPNFNYAVNVIVSPAVMTAVHVTSGRVITLTQSAIVKDQDAAVADSAGFLNPTP